MPDGSSATIVAAWFSGPPVLDELTAEGDVRHAPPAMHIATVRPHRDIKVPSPQNFLRFSCTVPARESHSCKRSRRVDL
jgi:hypothetical protein